MRNAIYSVTELTGKLKILLESSFYMVWVRGEITGVRQTSAGHVYFTLKDAEAQLPCVWFAGKQRAAEQHPFDPLTGEVFKSRDGLSVARLEQGGEFICSGRLSYYPRGGSCQLMIDHIMLAGIGLLAQAFEARKQELAQKGYFAVERKRPIPKNPKRIALITSAQGAALQDFLKIAQTRGFSSKIRLFPTLVQGREAAGEIAKAIELACAQAWAQVIVLIRGGGSLEDLWCFNEVIVAEAVFKASIPVVAGIGHEIDTTLADLTADLRAATPTHAAELLWTPRERMCQEVEAQVQRLTRAFTALLTGFERQLAHEERSLKMLSPDHKLKTLEERLKVAEDNFRLRVLSFLEGKEQSLAHLEELFWRLLSPKRFDSKVLALNYSEERLLRAWTKSLERKEELSLALAQRLPSAFEQRLNSLESELGAANALLLSNNPLNLLERGYALVEQVDGQVVTSVTNLKAGDQVVIRLRDGRLSAGVTKCETESLEEAFEP